MRLCVTTCSPILAFIALGALADTPEIQIALTNDDGWQADGIQILYRSLEKSGHDVTLVAPADQQSGSSAAINMGQLRVIREAESQFSVHACNDDVCTSTSGAEPATSALVGIDLTRRKNGGVGPDILISGTNEGANLGSATQLSGTVGAAVAASSRTLNGAVPAIAVSTDVPDACREKPACAKAHYDRVGRFVANLLEHLAAKADHEGRTRILPEGLVLNVNYPPVEARGIRVVAQDRAINYNGATIRLEFSCEYCVDLEIGDTAEAALSGFSKDDVELATNSELTSFADGYVTIVPMHIDYTADNYEQYADLFSGIKLKNQ